MAEVSKRSRGRPKGGTAFGRHEIVAAALDAISKGGYDRLSMRGVARDIGASLATVQRHFATKQDLWCGAVDSFLDGFTPTRPSSELDGSNLAATIEQLLSRSGAHPGLVSALASDRSDGHEQRWTYLAKRVEALSQPVLNDVLGLQEAGLLRQVDVQSLAMLLNLGVGGLSGASSTAQAMYGYDLSKPEDRKRLSAAIADIIQFGVVAR